MKKQLVALTFLTSLSTLATTVPKDAQETLNALPGKQITLDLVIGSGLKSSDSFQQVKALLPEAEVAELQSKVPFDHQLTLSGLNQSSENEPQIQFAPSKSNKQIYTLGASTYFSSGTQLAVELSQDVGDLEVSGTSYDVNEAKATVSVTQNLWQDFFGHSSRQGKKQGQLASEAARDGFYASVEGWVLELTSVYYRAWFAQASTRAAQETVTRRKRLLKTTRLKAKRGTAEKPDLLQAESALLASTAQLSDARQTMEDIWRSLVTTLKFPKSWLKIDPIFIPIALDNPVRNALDLCGPLKKPNPAPENTSQTQSLENAYKASEAALAAAKDGMRPSLGLTLQGIYNGVDADKISNSWDETWAGDNPSLAVGLTFSMPLERHAAKAQLAQAIGQQQRAAAQWQQEKSNLGVNWINSCKNLHRLASKSKSLKTAYDNQALRLKLENKRFRIGRVPLQNVIMAGDDSSQAHLAYLQTQLDTRLAAWQVQQMTGGIRTYVEKLTGINKY